MIVSRGRRILRRNPNLVQRRSLEVLRFATTLSRQAGEGRGEGPAAPYGQHTPFDAPEIRHRLPPSPTAPTQ
jgi:hypothetical protein